MRLKSIVRFTAVPPAGVATLAHGLNLTGPVVPDECKKSNANFIIISADDTTVSVMNGGALAADCDVLCEHWHTVERAFGDLFTADNGVNLTPQPFVDDNNIATLVSGVDLQDAYNNTVGSPATIQLDVIRDGIRITDIAGQGTPGFEVVGANSAQDSIMVTRTFVGAGHGIDVSMGVGTTGTLLNGTLAGTGFGINLSRATGGAANAMINLSESVGSTGTLLSITKTPAAATAGTGVNITYGVNTTGVMMNLSQSGSGIVFQVINSGAGAIFNVIASGAGQVANWSHSGTNANPFAWNNSSNTAGVSTSWTRQPTVATGGSIFRLSSNINFTGINLEIIQSAVGGSDQGIELVTRGSGIGCRIHDQAGSLHTGTALRLQHDVTGSTGLLLEMLKNPPAATAGDIASLTIGVNASGNVWAVTHSGSGDYQAITHTGSPGRYLTLSHTGTGEIWRMTGAAAAILNVLTVDGRNGIGVVPPTPASGALPLQAWKRAGAGFAGSEGQRFHGTGSTVGAVTADIVTVLLSDNTVYVVEACIAGRDAAGVERAAYVVRAGVFRQAAGAATFITVASPQAAFTDETNILADGTLVVVGNNIVVRVTGTAGNTYAWAATVTVTPVSTSA